jgi:hypothetical protein
MQYLNIPKDDGLLPKLFFGLTKSMTGFKKLKLLYGIVAHYS